MTPEIADRDAGARVEVFAAVGAVSMTFALLALRSRVGRG